MSVQHAISSTTLLLTEIVCVYGTLASPAGSKAKEDVTTHSAEVGPGAESASKASSTAPAPAATETSSPAATGTDVPAQRPAATSEPELTRLPSSGWEQELVLMPEDNTVEDLTHQRGGTRTGGKGKHHPEGAYQENTETEAHNTDQTPKPNVKITFMVLTRDLGRESIETHWPDGSLSGKTLKDVIHEAEMLVRRVDTEKLDSS